MHFGDGGVGGGGGGGDGVCGSGGCGCVASKSSSISSNTHVTIWSVNHLPNTVNLAVFHFHNIKL